jgi:protein-S-isoprenylcysteine O-methyltransferase Ste14
MNVYHLVKTLKKRIFLSQVFGVLVLLTLLLSRESWGINHLVFSESLYLFGVALVATCVVGRAWSLSYISGSKNKKLITTGPYSMCRNPLYFSNFMGAIGLALCTESLILPFLTIVGFSLIYPRVMSREEKKLHRLFGIEFSSYCEKVPRFFPSPRVFTEDDSVIISTKSFRNGLRDIGVFVMGIGFIEFIEALHTAHILPIFFKLY